MLSFKILKLSSGNIGNPYPYEGKLGFGSCNVLPLMSVNGIFLYWLILFRIFEWGKYFFSKYFGVTNIFEVNKLSKNFSLLFITVNIDEIIEKKITVYSVIFLKILIL